MNNKLTAGVCSAADVMERGLTMATCVLNDADLYVAAINTGLGPADKQNLGEWVADTTRGARHRIAKSTSLSHVTEPGSRRSPGTYQSGQSASGEPQ